MRLAERAAAGGDINEISLARAELAAAGIEVTDLTDSNPTRHGLLRTGVMDVVARHTRASVRYEPDARGPQPAREALAVRYGGRADDYWLTASTSEAYSWLLTLLADPGQQVAIPSPGYPLIDPIARLAGIRTADYRLHYVDPHGWILDLDTLAASVADPRTRAVVVVSPGNPTGAYLGGARDEVIDLIAARGIPLVADEVFGEFPLDRAPFVETPRSLGGEARTVTLTLGGLSKLLCAPHLKLAWIRISGPPGDVRELRDALDRIADAFLPVNAPVAAALPELLDLADASVAATRERLATNLAGARTIFADGPYRIRRCEGGWTVLLDAPPLPAPTDLALELLRREHLGVHPGWFYDLPARGCLALSLLPEPDRFGAGLVRLRRGLEELVETAS